MPEGSLTSQPEIPVRSKEIIQTEIQAIKQAEQESDLSYKALPLEKRDQYKAILVSVGDKYQTDKDFIAAYSDPEARNNLFTDPELGSLFEVNIQAFQQGQRLEQLEEEYLPYRIEELSGQVRELSSRINFRALLQYYANLDQSPDSSFAWTMELNNLRNLRIFETAVANGSLIDSRFRLYSDDSDLSYSRWIENRINETKEQWDKNGFLGDLNQDYQYQPTNPDENKDTYAEMLSYVLKNYRDDKSLEDIYRPLTGNISRSHIISNFERFLIDAENSLGKGIKLPNFDEVLDFSPDFYQALDQVLDSQFERLGKRGEISNTIFNEDYHEVVTDLDIDHTMNSIEIIGINPEDNLALDTQTLRKWLKNYIPARFLSNIVHVRYMNPNKEKVFDESGNEVKDVEQVGAHIGLVDLGHGHVASYIYVFKELKKAAEDEASKKDLRQAVQQLNILETTAHEIGHRSHYTLSVDEMRGWEGVMNNEDIAVSWYVGFSRKAGERRGKVEDFSETFSMFLTNPYVLYVIAPQRYRYMWDLFLDNTRAEEQNQRRDFIQNQLIYSHQRYESMGFTPELIKKAFIK